MTVNRQTFNEVMVPNYQPADIVPVRGEASRIWDQQGKEYIDLAGGIAVTVLGHASPVMIDALTAQAHKLWHLSNVMTNEPALQLAQAITQATFADRVFFCNSGAEANEAAFKLARRHGNNIGPHKNKIISFHNAFHGRTLFTVSVGGQAKYTQGFEPIPGGIRHLPFNDIQALEAAMSDEVCAIVLEPIQGEGGILPATQAFIEGARCLASKYNALLVFDEVQSGNGRSGHLYAYQHYNVVPDVLTTAKGLGGGIPIGAMLTTAQHAETLAFGTHGSTYGGNPLACAVALAVFEAINTPAMMANVMARTAQLHEGLRAIGKRYGVFEGVRGLGLLVGAPMSAAWKGRAKEIVSAGLRHGVWTLVAGPDVLRMAPALNITEAELAEGLQRLEAACAEVTAMARAA